MDNVEEISDHDGPNTSCRIDHDNSLNQQLIQAICEQPSDETRRLVDGGPLSNHLIDLERQQIHQSQQQRTLFSGASLTCLETSLEEPAPANLLFSKSSHGHTQSSTHRDAAMLAFQPSADQRSKTPSRSQVDWFTEVVGSHMVVTSQNRDEMEWDPSILESSAQKKTQRDSQRFTFYPSATTLHNLHQSNQIGGIEQQDQELLTSRTVQSSCFEPRFEHEEGIMVHQSSNILIPQLRRSHGTPKAENAPKIDINEGPQDVISQLTSLQPNFYLLGSEQIQLQQQKIEDKIPHGGYVPKQRLLTLEDAAEAQNSNAMAAQNKEMASNDGIKDDDEDAEQPEPTDYADHLYDSDGGCSSKHQHRQQTFNSDHKPAATMLPHRQHFSRTPSNHLNNSGSLANHDSSLHAPSHFTASLAPPAQPQQPQASNIAQSSSNPDLLRSGPYQMSQNNSSSSMLVGGGLSSSQTRSQPNLFFQPFQRIHSVQELGGGATAGDGAGGNVDLARLSSYRDSSYHFGGGSYGAGAAGASTQSNQNRVRDDLRDSTTTTLTQLVHSQNHNSVAITQEPPHHSHTAPPTEESKAPQDGDQQQQPQQSGFALPHPEQLKSYEKMVAQIIRDSIEKENRSLKQQIKQLQLNEQKRNNHLRSSPFQPKNPKIFSKPNFPVSKSFSGRNSAFKYRPGGQSYFNFQHPMRHAKNTVDRKGAFGSHEDGDYFDQSNGRSPPRSGVGRDDAHLSKTNESIEGSEVIEELIEIEESGESHSVENQSCTVRTNCAGGRGSICSVIENDNTSNLYAEEFKNNGGRMSPHAVLSQRFFDQQSFYGFRRDLTRLQKRSEMACTSAFSQGPDNKELEYEDLEALFNFQGDHLTENDESEAPFYVPSCMDDCRAPRFHGSELFQKYRGRHQREETLTQVNMSQNQELQLRNENCSVDAIYKSNTFLVKQVAESENGNHQRRKSLDSVGLEESKAERHQNQGKGQMRVEADDFYRRDKHSHSSKSEERRPANSRMMAHGNIDDDDIVNQNSSHDGRSHLNRSRMQNDLTQSMINEQASSPNIPQESALLEEDPRLRQPQAEKATQMSDVGKLRKSTDSSVKKLDGPQRFTYFSASSLSDDRWICPICLDIFHDAVETPCCHNLFCERCIKNTRCCPLCNMRIVGALKPNIPIRRLVLELSMKCPNQECNRKVKRCDLERHLEICEFTPVQCANSQSCGEILRKDLEKHLHNECMYRQVTCLLHCGVRLVLNQMDEHIANDCPKSELQCSNQCGRVIERGKMDDHLRVDCPEQVINCPNKGESLFEDGCSAVLRRKDIEQHRHNCAFRRIVCPNQKCQSVIMFKNLETHDERCLFKIVECDNKCGTRVLRQNIQQHREQCEYQLVRCPYYDLGCKIEILRKDYREHLVEENFNHSIVFIEGQKKKNKEIEDLQTEISSLRKDYDSEMQWMYVEMQMMKAEMKKLRNKDSSSGEQNPFENQNSSFGENQPTSLWKRMADKEVQPSYPQQRCSFVLGRGGQGDANTGQFGGTRYNQQSMSVNSTSLANNRQSNNFQGSGDRLNQAQLVDISDEIEPHAPPLPSHNFGSIDHSSRSGGTLVQPHEIIRPTTRRGRNQIGRVDLNHPVFEDKSQSTQGLQRPGIFNDRFDASSHDYVLGRQNSIHNSQDNFLGDEGAGQTGLSTQNPLTVIDGARNHNDSERRIPMSTTSNVLHSLSNAMNTMQSKPAEASGGEVLRNSWLQARNAKPPLFRHQIMLRASEPNYSASQNNSLSVSHENHSEMQPRNNTADDHQRSVIRASQEDNQGESSERKNPLAYLLASVNASVDTTNQANPNATLGSSQPSNITMAGAARDHTQTGRLRSTLFQEEPTQGPSAPARESIINMMDRFSREDEQRLSTTQKQQILQRMTGSGNAEVAQDERILMTEDERRYRQLINNAALTSSVGSALGGIRACRIRKVQAPARKRTIQHSQNLTQSAVGAQADPQTTQQSQLAQNQLGQAVQTQMAATTTNQNDLDSSNVLYDADFELEEEKDNNHGGSFSGENGHQTQGPMPPGYSFMNP